MMLILKAGLSCTHDAGFESRSVMHTQCSFQKQVSDAHMMLMLTCESHLQAVMVVHHGCDAVKPEAVKLVLINPPPCI